MSGETTSSAVQFDRIGQIAITVSDLNRAREFYRDVLEMKFLFDAGSMTFLQCGDVRLMIKEEKEPAGQGGTILYFKVADLQATYAALKERGVEFLQAPNLVAKMPDHDLWMAFLKDPDGHTVGVMCEVRGRAGIGGC